MSGTSCSAYYLSPAGGLSCYGAIRRTREGRVCPVILALVRQGFTLLDLPSSTWVAKGMNSDWRRLSRVERCSSWEDFVGALSGLSNNDKGDAIEALVKAYLSLEPAYSSKPKHVWWHKEVGVRT